MYTSFSDGFVGEKKAKRNQTKYIVVQGLAKQLNAIYSKKEMEWERKVLVCDEVKQLNVFVV